MERFEYASPANLQEAVGLLGERWGDAELLAGGTDLLSLMKNYVATPRRLVSLRNIADLHAIHDAGDLHIGALTTLEELREHEVVRRELPALAQAAAGVPSLQIRTMGTVGGDLCQRPRCWYYRNGMGLLGRDSTGRSLVADGDNRYHAVLGNSGAAKFVHASSLAPALIALGARVTAQGANGVRDIPLEMFFRTPESEGERESVLAPNEIVTFVTVPAESRGAASATYEVRQREALDWPLATASVALKMEGGRVAEGRVVLGAVAPVPWLAHQATADLAGKEIDEASAARIGMVAVEEARPLSRNGYKVKLASVAVKRALLQAAGGGS